LNSFLNDLHGSHWFSEGAKTDKSLAEFLVLILHHLGGRWSFGHYILEYDDARRLSIPLGLGTILRNLEIRLLGRNHDCGVWSNEPGIMHPLI
jgi:hypothetical protein